MTTATLDRSAHGPPVELPALLQSYPQTSPLPPQLHGVLNDLYESHSEVVTLDDLARYRVGLSPRELARLLRSRGWLRPMRTRGAWAVPFVWPAEHFEWFLELQACLAARPDTPACIGGKSVAQVRNYLIRATRPCIGFPPGLRVPRCLDRYWVCRWQPQLPLDDMHGLPVWKDETLLVFMAAKPADVSWEDVADWLLEVCYEIDAELVMAELAGRPRAVWMATAFLADAGERPDVTNALLAAAPAGAGPYVFDHKDRHGNRTGRLDTEPLWYPRFELHDYVLATWWLPKWR